MSSRPHYDPVSGYWSVYASMSSEPVMVSGAWSVKIGDPIGGRISGTVRSHTTDPTDRSNKWSIAGTWVYVVLYGPDGSAIRWASNKNRQWAAVQADANGNWSINTALKDGDYRAEVYVNAYDGLHYTHARVDEENQAWGSGKSVTTLQQLTAQGLLSWTVLADEETLDWHRPPAPPAVSNQSLLRLDVARPTLELQGFARSAGVVSQSVVAGHEQPSVATDSIYSGSFITQSQQTFFGTAHAGDRVVLFLDWDHDGVRDSTDIDVGNATADANGNFSVDVRSLGAATGLDMDACYISAYAQDQAGHRSDQSSPLLPIVLVDSLSLLPIAPAGAPTASSVATPCWFGGAGQDFRQRAGYMNGRDGDDMLIGSSLSDTLLGEAGNDTLFGTGGQDVMYGGAGDDSISASAATRDHAALIGDSGDDVLTGSLGYELFVGGQGNDTIAPGGGRDVILFNKGDGQDAVFSSELGGTTFSLGGGVKLSELAFQRNGNDLTLFLAADGSDKVTFRDWYRAANPADGISALQLVNDMSSIGSPLVVKRFDFMDLVESYNRSAQGKLNTMSQTYGQRLLSADPDLGSKYTNPNSGNTLIMGGDVAAYYGNGSTANLSMARATTVLGDAVFGAASQPITPALPPLGLADTAFFPMA